MIKSRRLLTGRTVIITFPKVIIPVTLVALFFLGVGFTRGPQVEAPDLRRGG